MTTSPTVNVVPAQRVSEGGGFQVYRPLPVAGLEHFDPFLLVDEMGPVNYGPGEAVGAPDHPHRGFETVTYMIDGSMMHEDSHGHRGSIRNGDVQWMTAGAGVIHSEMPSQEILERGGHMHGFQIWINLPKGQKMVQPRYQEYKNELLPLVNSPGLWVRVIAGEFQSERSPIETTVPVTMLHVRLDEGARAAFSVAPGSNAIVHAIAGNGRVEGREVNEHQAALLQNASVLNVEGGARGFEALVLAGVPLNEPVARYGPFVMNTREEILAAFEDFRAGRFGEIARTN